MPTLPDPDPGTPDSRSAGRYLAWLARRQRRTLVVGVALGMAWMAVQAALPTVIGRTIDAGVIGRDGGALLTGTAVVALLAALQAVTGVLRHRQAAFNWLQGALRTQQALGHHVAEHGGAVAATTTTGEVISSVDDDAERIGDLFDVVGRFSGAVLAAVLVAVVVLRIDVLLGGLVLVGVPLLAGSLLVLVRPLSARQSAHREAEGQLTALGADTVAGLRVLRGIGGEDAFVQRYVERSRQVRAAGERVAGPQAGLDAAQVLLPGAFMVVLTWVGARAALEGRITPGELVTLYGYAAFLQLPLSTASEALGKAVRARVATRRVVALLRTRAAAGPAVGPSMTAVAEPPPGAALTDPASGLVLAPGRLTALVAGRGEESAAVAERLALLGGIAPAPDAVNGAAGPALGGVPLAVLPLDAVRRRVLVSEAEPRLFTGTLREEVDPYGRRGDDALLAAITVADAVDVLDALPDGLDGRVEERGRAFSGGQRQRLVLARAVLADPEVLVLVEPTSAVDAHTEARIADRLRAARAGRTTLLTTSSPLLLDRADRVAYLEGGRVTATGTHRELLRRHPGYRRTVTREEGAT